MPTNNSEYELSGRPALQTDPTPSPCLWPVSQQAAARLWQTPRAAVSAWQTGSIWPGGFLKLKITHYEERRAPLKTDCSLLNQDHQEEPTGEGQDEEGEVSGSKKTDWLLL